MNEEKSTLVQYTELLLQYRSPSAKVVRDFFDRNRHDTTFVRRACLINKVFQVRRKPI